jgi:hypothetical protein
LFGHVEGFATGLGDGNWRDYEKLLDDDVRWWQTEVGGPFIEEINEVIDKMEKDKADVADGIVVEFYQDCLW